GPSRSTRSATTLPPRSIHVTPSNGTTNCADLRKLIHARVTEAVVSRARNPAANRIRYSRFIGDWNACAPVEPRPHGKECTFAANEADWLARLSPILRSSSRIIAT